MHGFRFIIFNIYLDIESLCHVVEANSSVFSREETQEVLHYFVDVISHVFGHKLFVFRNLGVFECLVQIFRFVLNLVLNDVYYMR